MLVAYTGYAVNEDLEESQQRIVNEAGELTASAADHVETSTGKARLLLDQMTEEFPRWSTATEGPEAYSGSLLKVAARHQEIALAAVLDVHGEPLGDRTRAAVAGLSLLSSRELEHHRQHRDEHVRAGFPLIHPVTGRTMLPLSRRISGPQGEFLGVAWVGLSLDQLQDYFARVRRTGDSQMLLLDKSGNVLLRDPAHTGPVKKNVYAGQGSVTAYIDRHASGRLEASSPFDGITRSYTFRHIESSPLIVVHGETTDEQLGAWYARTYARLGYLSVVLVLLGLAAVYIDRLIRRSRFALDELNEALARASSFELALHQHAMVSRADMNDRIIGANDKFCEISGFSREELIGKTHRLLNAGEHPPEFFADLHQTIKGGKVWTGDICNKTRQGDFFWTRSTIIPFRNAAGEIYEYVSVRTDISELKVMQRQIEIANESLSASFDLLYATVNSSASGIVTTNKDGTIVMMNAAAQSMLGYTQKEAESVLSMLDLHDPLQVSGAIRAAEGEATTHVSDVTYEVLAATVAALPEREWVYLTATGESLPVSINIAPLLDQSGGLQGYVTSFNDLTRLKQVEVMKSDFVSMVSHELRTPLTSIKGALTLLDKMAGAAMPDNQRKLLNIGVHNCEALVNLVSDILDFDKISRNAMTYEMKVHDVRALVEKAVSDTQPYATPFNVTYWIDRDDHELPVLVDTQRFEQILRNLLSNAAKFSHPGSEVLVSAHAEAGVVTISVADTGVGIPEAFQAKIFQKFSQVSHSDRPTKVKGTGLGLSIAKMMIEAHGGSIGFRSTEGVGTTFFIKLPLTLDHVAGKEERQHGQG